MRGKFKEIPDAIKKIKSFNEARALCAGSYGPYAGLAAH